MDDEPVISVEHVSKDFVLPHQRANSIKSLFTGAARRATGPKHKKETQHALKNISFEVKKGEFFGIVGRNGSGKSTMLKILAGIYQPTKGEVITRGKLVPFIELGVGFNPELTGRENVYLNGAMFGFSHKEIDAMYDDIVAFAELERFMDQKLKNYSSGMQVRLAFSMATRSEADILLIDEVLAVGDADFQRKCFDYFRKLKRDKKTVVFVSHDMSAVREYCDRAALIDKSIIVKLGSTEEVAKLYTELFMKETDDANVPSGKKKRLGNQEVRVSSVASGQKTYRADKDEQFIITVQLEAKNPIADNVSIGFLVRNASGVPILGMNTHELHHTIGGLGAGEKVAVTWTVPNVLGDGKYSIDAAVTSTDGTVTYDWWEDAASFRAYREEYSPYQVTPTVHADIQRL